MSDEPMGVTGLMRERSGVTISEVAAAAGVSRQTVSNVLNAPDRVAPATAERVRRAIDELGYLPNRAARNLRERTSRCIGFKIAAPSGLNNLLDRFLHALAESAGGVGYHLLLFSAATADEELAAYAELTGTGTVDGFVLADIDTADKRPDWCAERGIPCVSFGRPADPGRCSWVDVDGADGLAQSVDHLVARGHRRIAYLGWPEGQRVGDERRAGWRAAMRRHGLATEGLSGAGAEDPAEIAAVARRMMEQPDPPTAFACGSDTFAVAARQAIGADSAGRPRVEAVGYDDSPSAALMTPPLSSVRQPLDKVAHHVVDLLVRQFREPGVPPEGVMLRPELVARERPGEDPR
ncbi:LacI family DNA-binding transcriptional regulator [Actinomadura sp. NBRC 104425]|uniref:LacI family DNA-binding transcriptional regulator n=1 Tax=Actinomadura sp. NBRC 104425 TaxID=3032204 RepID=UPI002555D1DB|nr:LacI family DNA-binding transcriptional regulator [Actinomadura sp. NBRC 104425]